MMHERWDPTCVRFRTPRNRFEVWVFNRQRGKACRVCFPRNFAFWEDFYKPSGGEG